MTRCEPLCVMLNEVKHLNCEILRSAQNDRLRPAFIFPRSFGCLCASNRVGF